MEVKAWTLDGTFTESLLLVFPKRGISCSSFVFGKCCFRHEAATLLEGKGSSLCFLNAGEQKGWISLKYSFSFDGKWQMHYFQSIFACQIQLLHLWNMSFPLHLA